MRDADTIIAIGLGGFLLLFFGLMISYASVVCTFDGFSCPGLIVNSGGEIGLALAFIGLVGFALSVREIRSVDE